MQSERGRSSTDIFNEALERAPAERAAFLERSCAGDTALRRQVDLLLRYHDEAGDFLAAPAAATAPELLTADPEALIGQRLGSYRIDAVLGTGGMGVVYLACDERLGRKVGLKLIPRALVSNEAQLDRLKLEARTASALNHPNIVTVHEIGQADSTHYIAIEFIEGPTLRERITRGPVPPDETLAIAQQVASALCVAHRAGIVHRDIKPENIMIRPDGLVKVLDFGIAKSNRDDALPALALESGPTNNRTRVGQIIGTLRYMAPEQARGEAVDARSDIWSVGVVLYEMLSGRAPFDGQSPAEVRTAVIEQEAPGLTTADIPWRLQNIVDKCLRKNPSERFQASEELLAELRAAAGEKPARRSPLPRFLATAALLVVLSAAAFFFFRGGFSRKESAVAPPDISRKSIAVLPFADLSPDQDQQYFSDGIAEEILNALAHVKDLKVAGRSSSFSFRGKNADLRVIGSTLAVAHVLEGSVRKQGDRVRINVKLIQVSDGFHLWSQSYDGDLRDVFSLQERIARGITDQLDAVLNREQMAQLVKTATTNGDAYSLFLEATAVFNRRDGARFRDAIAQLQEAVRLDPKFARAHARLASLLSIAPQYDVQLNEDASTWVTREARIATELDPTLAEPHAAVGQTLFIQRRFAEARASYARALQIDPDDLTANFWLGTLLSSTGYAKASATVLDKLLIRDPMYPNALLWRGWVHLQLGEIDQAERSIRRAADAGLTSVGLAFAHVARARGDNAALVDWLGRGLEIFVSDLPKGTSRVIAAGTVGNEADRTAAIAAIERYLATQPRIISGAIPLALIWLGQPERALAVAQEKPTRNDTLFLPSLWTDAGRNARMLPQFASFAQHTGLADFWDKSGSPDLCAKAQNAEYVCDAVGANNVAAASTLTRAAGVAIGPAGIIYVADFAEHAVRQINSQGVMTDFAGSRGAAGFSDGAGARARFNHPAALALGSDGSIYVADTNNHVVRKITPAGVVSTLAGEAGHLGSEDGPATSARFNYPTGVALDPGGNIWVADFGNHTIRKISPNGVVSTVAGMPGEIGNADGQGSAARFNQVHGIAVDAAGHAYAADFGNHTIRKISPEGVVVTVAGLPGTPGSNDGVGAAARFCAPYAVAVDAAAQVFVADTSNQTIRRITPDGSVTTVAGQPGHAGSVDGPGATAQFALPAGIALDQAGNIYVADFGNYAIRKITPDRLVSTIAGVAAKPVERDATVPLPPPSR